MSRLYLIFIVLFLGFTSTAQTELKKYLEIAEEKYQKGDFIHALQYYEKAMALDSNTINTIWNYAQTLRAYKDYSKAAYYYGEVYDREGTKLYPPSLMYYGLMLKQTGRYDEALEVFKKAKKVYRKDTKGFLYQKSRQEISSCLWAKNAVVDTSSMILEHLPPHINTPDAEFAHRLYDNKLFYSSLRADSIGSGEEVYATTYKTHLYTSKISSDTFGPSEKVKDLFWKEYSSGNGSFSPDGRRFYFSLCEDNSYNYRCKIMVANFANDGFVNIDSLGPIINQPGANTTMPFSGQWDDDEVLFFASNREGSRGGMDIWYSIVSGGNQYKEPKNLRSANSLDNELSPYWDNETKTLYFSSAWHDGFGGYDIFKIIYNNGFQDLENIGYPYNSPANDLYYFKTSTKDSAFFSSNRLGVNYSKNPTCCSDIFMVRKPIAPPPPTIAETLEDLNNRLPVTLYFHNDIPNPRSWDTTSNVNYIDSYYTYTKMIDTYKKEYAKGLRGEEAADAKDDIEDFFLEYVDQGVKDLELFRDLLYAELEKGRKFQLTVKGFASPLAKTDYNVNLTKRRIASLKNYLMEYDDGVFVPFFEGTHESGGKIRIVEIPFGEYTAASLTSDNPNDVQNSVYSRAAAIERKIEVQSVEELDKEESEGLLEVDVSLFDAGSVQSGETIEKTFTIRNYSKKTIAIDSVRIPCNCNSASVSEKILEPGAKTTVTMTFDTKGYTGKTVKSVYLEYGDKEVRLVITAELE